MSDKSEIEAIRARDSDMRREHEIGNVQTDRRTLLAHVDALEARLTDARNALLKEGIRTGRIEARLERANELLRDWHEEAVEDHRGHIDADNCCALREFLAAQSAKERP